MSAPAKVFGKRRHLRGSVLIEGLLSVLVFSVGMVGLMMLLSATLVETGNARHRSEASLLASDLIAQMWRGDRSPAALQTRFNENADEYRAWLARVQSTLPGADRRDRLPTLVIDAERRVTLTLRWQLPGDRDVHTLVVQAMVTD